MQYRNMVEAFALLIAKLNIDPQEIASAKLRAHPDLSKITLNEIDTPWEKDLRFGQWLALAPGASHDTKQCPESVWIDLLKNIIQTNDSPEEVSLVFVGNEQDRRVCVAIADKLSWPGTILNLSGKLSLLETAAALAKVKVLLTNDSGLLHIAEAMGTPVVAMFGPTSEEFGFSPWRSESLLSSSPLGCRPCSKHGKAPCRFGDKLCFEAINLVDVARYAKRLVLPQKSRIKGGDA